MVTLKLGDCRAVLPTLDRASVDAIVADPPYGDTSLDWDQRVKGWLPLAADVLKPNGSIWVFGSLRFLAPLFAEMDALGFRYSQDIVWEKQNGTGFHVDRFRRVHEHVVMFYRGQWRDVYHDTQYSMDATAKTVRRKTRPAHTGRIEASAYVSQDGGPRLMRSVPQVRNEHSHAIHPTQKPLDLLRPIIRYSVPPGGIVLDCFGGSGSTAVAALEEGRKAIYIERHPDVFAVGSVHIAEAQEEIIW